MSENSQNIQSSINSTSINSNRAAQSMPKNDRIARKNNNIQAGGSFKFSKILKGLLFLFLIGLVGKLFTSRGEVEKIKPSGKNLAFDKNLPTENILSSADNIPFEDNLLATCIESPDTNDHCDPHSTFQLFYCTVEYLNTLPIIDHNNPPAEYLDPEYFNSLSKPPLYFDPLRHDKSGFKNTAAHYAIVNHEYKKLFWLFKTFPTHKAEMIKEQDANGCNLLVIAGKVAAPSIALRELINKDTAVMANNEGETPLMRAALGQDPKVLKKLLKAIGKDRIHHELKRQDSKGRTVADWNKMNGDQIWEEFSRLYVDAHKAANHCFNALTRYSEHLTLIDKDLHEAVVNSGLEVTFTQQEEASYTSLRATKENAKKLLEIATVKGPSANRIRRDWTQLLKPDLITSDKTNTKKAITKYWKGIKKEMGQLLAHPISSESLMNVYLGNQLENRRLIQEFADAANTEERHIHNVGTPRARSRGAN